jgi:DNA-binding SARP family transcriptional activator
MRRALAPLDGENGSRLRTVSGGYLLDVHLDELDAEVFAAWVWDGRRVFEEGDPVHAREMLGHALALWRGPPLAEVVFEDFAQGEIRRLEELRLSAIETRIDVDLQLGRPAELIPELERVLADHPTREQIAGQLMTALIRARDCPCPRATRDARRPERLMAPATFCHVRGEEPEAATER